MKSRTKTVARKPRRTILTLSQRVERLERHYFAQKPAVPASGPRFIVQGDVVHDSTTGLVWTRKNVGKTFNWKDAKAAASAVRIDGHQDWRFPTIQELLSLVDFSRTSPAIDPAFECESNWYWSATPYASSPGGYAWCVNLRGGNSDCDYQFNGNYVRAVRAGQ